MEAASLIRQSRQRAGLTQAELARRLRTTQSAVARLESERSSPRLATLERALLATGHELSLWSTKRRPSVDETLIARQLRLTPAERLRAFQTAYAQTRLIAGAARRR
jgi:transcriptional regulator with XRE-family HTH domain